MKNDGPIGLWSLWLGAAAVACLMCWVFMSRYQVEFITSDVVVRANRFTGQVASKLNDQPWVKGYFTDPQELEARYDAQRREQSRARLRK